MSGEPLVVREDLVLPADELRVSFSRSGGPGGQNVNKVETRVVLRFDVRGSRTLGEGQRRRIEEKLASRLTGEGELIVAADTHRERARNLAEARERLAALLRGALHRDPPRKSTRPTRGSVRRRLQEKKRRGDVKRDRRRPRDGGD